MKSTRIKKRTVLLAVQVLLFSSSANANNSGGFAVVRRFQKYVEGANPTSCSLPFHKRNTIHSCTNANYNQSQNHNTENQGNSDNDRIQEGRFAIEYEQERKAMRSAEDAHVRHHHMIEDEDISDSSTTQNSSRNRRKPTFVHQHNDPIFV